MVFLMSLVQNLYYGLILIILISIVGIFWSSISRGDYLRLFSFGHTEPLEGFMDFYLVQIVNALHLFKDDVPEIQKLIKKSIIPSTVEQSIIENITPIKTPILYMYFGFSNDIMKNNEKYVNLWKNIHGEKSKSILLDGKKTNIYDENGFEIKKEYIEYISENITLLKSVFDKLKEKKKFPDVNKEAAYRNLKLLFSYEKEIYRCYETRKIGGVVNFKLFKIYMDEYIEFIFKNKIPDLWLKWVDHYKKTFGSIVDVFSGEKTVEYMNKLPMKIAGIEEKEYDEYKDGANAEVKKAENEAKARANEGVSGEEVVKEEVKEEQVQEEQVQGEDQVYVAGGGTSTVNKSDTVKSEVEDNVVEGEVVGDTAEGGVVESEAVGDTKEEKKDEGKDNKKADVKETFITERFGDPFSGILKALASIVDFFESMGIVVTSIVSIITNPIAIIKWLIGIIFGLIIYLVWYILFVVFGTFFAFIGAYVWVSSIAILGTVFWSIIFAAYGLIYFILTLIDYFTGGMIMRMMRCENLPNVWHTGDNIAYSNKFKLSFFCARKCGSRYKPDGIWCSRIPRYQPSQCPQSLIYNMYLKMKGVPGNYDSKTKLLYFKFFPWIKYFRESNFDKLIDITESYYEKVDYSRNCSELTDDYKYVIKYICNNIDKINDKDGSNSHKTEEIKDEIKKLCNVSYCDLDFTETGDAVAFDIKKSTDCAFCSDEVINSIKDDVSKEFAEKKSIYAVVASILFYSVIGIFVYKIVIDVISKFEMETDK